MESAPDGCRGRHHRRTHPHAAGDRAQGQGGQGGKRAYKCCVRGKEAHPALTPQGVNAIEYGARIVTYIRHMALEFTLFTFRAIVQWCNGAMVQRHRRHRRHLEMMKGRCYSNVASL